MIKNAPSIFPDSLLEQDTNFKPRVADILTEDEKKEMEVVFEEHRDREKLVVRVNIDRVEKKKTMAFLTRPKKASERIFIVGKFRYPLHLTTVSTSS